MSESVWNQKCLVSPSLISVCDMCNLESSVKVLDHAGIRMLHIDILDGHFSPSMPLGLDTVRQLRAKTDLLFDVHLMVNEHDFFIEELLDIGVEQIVFHCECEPHIDNRLNQIHRHGVRAGVALKPSTPLSVVDYVLEKCDTVLLMLINPGFAGGKKEGQVPYAGRKIRELRDLIRHRSLSTKIEIDGRISRENIAAYGGGGVDIFVAGSTCLDKSNLSTSIQNLCTFRNIVLNGGKKNG
ncbi:ribulose-phosphate 3-epimerase [Muricomes intestini]|uniref:ribulose-phosphate 3-epimerase n=1 Tax=Muricomes intestini TaxID=1796634 RepID=UPI002FE242A7